MLIVSQLRVTFGVVSLAALQGAQTCGPYFGRLVAQGSVQAVFGSAHVCTRVFPCVTLGCRRCSLSASISASLLHGPCSAHIRCLRAAQPRVQVGVHAISCWLPLSVCAGALHLVSVSGLGSAAPAVSLSCMAWHCCVLPLIRSV